MEFVNNNIVKIIWKPEVISLDNVELLKQISHLVLVTFLYPIRSPGRIVLKISWACFTFHNDSNNKPDQGGSAAKWVFPIPAATTTPLADTFRLASFR